MSANVIYLDQDGATGLTLLNLPDVVAGNNSTPHKVGVQSTANRQMNQIQEALQAIIGNDGITMLQIALDTTTLSAPYGFAAVANAPGSGGTFGATGSYGYRITATNASGETISTVELDVNLTAITQTVTLTWTQTPGATGYKIYRTSTPGTFVSPALLTTIGSGATVTFTDTGAAVGAGAPPISNTTSGWNLSPSVIGGGGVWASPQTVFYTVVGLDATGVILSQTFEATAVITVITQSVTLTWVNNPNAVTYSVYRTTVSGNYVSPALRVSGLAAGTTTFTDNGAALSPGTLTTLATFGIPPASGSFGFPPVLEGNEQINQQWFFWLNRVTPAATPESGNPRLVLVATQETA